MQLIYFDEQYSMFHDTYLYGRPDGERHRIERAVRGYTELLTGLLGQDDAALGEQLSAVALIGSQVTLRYDDDDAEETYTIVHPDESDADINRISFLSPIGLQLLGARRGSALKLAVPGGELGASLHHVKYAHIGGFEQE